MNEREPTPEEAFNRYLREFEEGSEPLPARLEQSWADRIIMALIDAGGIALVGALVYGALRMVGVAP